MNLKLKKVYTVSKKGKPERPRIFLQHLVCEAAGFEVKGEVYIKINEDKEEVVLQNFPFEEEQDIHIVHVASRKSQLSGKERPLVDTAGDKYCSFLDINQKIEVNVYRKGNKGQIIISGRLNTGYLIIVQSQLSKTSAYDYYRYVRAVE